MADLKSIPFHTMDIVIHVTSSNYEPFIDRDLSLQDMYAASSDFRFNLYETDQGELLYQANNGDFIQGFEVV